jgi:hypothetical protein
LIWLSLTEAESHEETPITRSTNLPDIKTDNRSFSPHRKKTTGGCMICSDLKHHVRRHRTLHLRLNYVSLFFLTTIALGQTPQTNPSTTVAPLTATALIRERTNTTQWFSATPNAEVYAHQDSLLRLSLSQRVRHFDYLVELGQSAELALPTDAVSPVSAQGQLGLGGSYYAANNNNEDPAAASLRQGFLRLHFKRDANMIRVGRFEFFDGQETAPRIATLSWLQNNRVAQRLVGNFGFSNGQRSFDGIDAKVGGPHWDLTAMAGRATQGVFNMNANPELNVDIQYLAYTRSLANDRIIIRGFGLGYHDGRTGLTKTDNRTAAARALDHQNIRIGSYGGDFISLIPAGRNNLDLVFWGVLQDGQWGLLTQRSGAFALEGGLKLDSIRTSPWLRGGMFRSTGDNNNTDGVHNTFFAVLPTPRVYARFPYFNTMNSKDEFVQIIDKPSAKIDLRSDLHFLQLTAPGDFWYSGGGAYDNKVFGYTGRPSNNHGSFSSLADISMDYAINEQFSFTAYYAKSFGKTVVSSIYTTDKDAQFGYFELNYKLSKQLTQVAKQ